MVKDQIFPWRNDYQIKLSIVQPNRKNNFSSASVQVQFVKLSDPKTPVDLSDTYAKIANIKFIEEMEVKPNKNIPTTYIFGIDLKTMDELGFTMGGTHQFILYNKENQILTFFSFIIKIQT